MRSQKDFPQEFYEDYLKKINVDLLKIFRIFLEEKILIKNLHKIFSSKNLSFDKSAKINRRMRSLVDLDKRSSRYLILREILTKDLGLRNF